MLNSPAFTSIAKVAEVLNELTYTPLPPSAYTPLPPPPTPLTPSAHTPYTPLHP